jgi:hypothetical protein
MTINEIRMAIRSHSFNTIVSCDYVKCNLDVVDSLRKSADIFVKSGETVVKASSQYIQQVP